MQAVRDTGGLRRFLDVSFGLHHENERWVPPLRSDLHDRLRFRRNPFWKRADGLLLIAWRRGAMVGRIAVVVDAWGTEPAGTATWGWFESDDDFAVAGALFEAAGEWAAGEGASALVGPASFPPFDGIGLLVDASAAPAFPASWEPPFYEKLIDACGQEPVEDLVTYAIELPHASGTAPGERRPRLRECQEALEQLVPELPIMTPETLADWAPSPAEVRFRFRRFKGVLDPSLVVIDRRDDNARAVIVAVPDLNEVLVGLRDPLGRAAARVVREARSRRSRASVVFLAAPDSRSAAELVGRLARQAGGLGYETLEITLPEARGELREEITRLPAHPARRHRLFRGSLAR